MKKFIFSLQRVLDYKEQIEESLRNEHAQAVRKILDKEKDIEKLEQEYDKYKSKIEQEKNGVLSIEKFREFEKYLSFVSSQIAVEKKNLDFLKREEEKARECVIEAKKETSSIQMLKDKKKNEYNEMLAKKQEQEIEEFVSNRSLARSLS